MAVRWAGCTPPGSNTSKAVPALSSTGLSSTATAAVKGVGRLLLEQAEQWAREEGIGIVRVWSSDQRHRAHRFYEREGYAVVKTQLAFVKTVDGEAHDLAGYTPRVQP